MWQPREGDRWHAELRRKHMTAALLLRFRGTPNKPSKFDYISLWSLSPRIAPAHSEPVPTNRACSLTLLSIAHGSSAA